MASRKMGLPESQDGSLGPCRTLVLRSIIVERVNAELSTLSQEIEALLEAPELGERAPSLERIEFVLTSGYAQALQLEAEHRRIEQRIREIAQLVSGPDGEQRSRELAKLARRHSRTDLELASLRRLLASLRQRAASLRAVA